jgi:hypothetical protein
MNTKNVAVLILIATISIFAHRTLLMVEDNGDGTIYIEGGLSTGGAIAGAKVIVVEKSTGRPLWQGVLGDDGSINAPQPKSPYLVKMIQSKGHIVTKPGPLPIKVDVKDDETQQEAPASGIENKKEKCNE